MKKLDRLWATRVAVLASVLCVMGCGDGQAGNALQEVVEWHLVEEPLVVIGHEADPAYALDRVRQAKILPSGMIAVTHGFEEVRLFSAEGEHVRSIGRRGEGPGEFTQLWTMHPIPPDSLIAVNSYPARASLFAMDGSFLGSFDVEGHGTLVDRLEDGWWIGTQLVSVDPPRVPGLFDRYVQVLRYSPEGRLEDTITTLVDARFFGTDASYLGAPFSPSAHVAVGPDRFYTAEGDLYDIEVRGRDGDVLGHIRSERERRVVDAEMIEEYWSRFSEERRAQGDELPFPDSLPAIGGLLVDDDRRLWVRGYALPSESPTWDVWEDGRLVARLRVPPELRVTDVDSDTILGVWTDPLGVQTVHRYQVRKG